MTEFAKLTSLLHWRPDSETITQGDLQDIYNSLFGLNAKAPNPSEAVVGSIRDEAAACLTAAHGANFENKIVLSIAARLTAERFMATKIDDAAWLSRIKKNQGFALLKRFQADFPSETEALRVLRSVALMTPENIHLNAFMYEPILDMSDEHLRALYRDVVSLK